MDDRISKAAGCEDFGAGYGGERDISFYAKSKSHAMRMKDRILKVKGVTRVEFMDDSEGNRGDGHMVYAKPGSRGVWRSYDNIQ